MLSPPDAPIDFDATSSPDGVILPRPWVPRIFAVHLAAIALLALGHLIAKYGLSADFGLTGGIHDPENESSIPNFFSALMLVATSLVALAVAAHHWTIDRLLLAYWILAGCTLLFLGFDEGAAIHDRLGFRTQEALDTSGVFFMGWPLPYLMMTILVLGAAVPFLKRLPRLTLVRVIVAAAIYVVSALGMEMLEGVLLEQHVGPNLTFEEALGVGTPPSWPALIFVEEFGEMIGVALALRALLLHLFVDLEYTRVEFWRSRRNP